MEKDKESFEETMARRKYESQRAFDLLFDRLEEGGKKAYEEYEQARKDVIKMSFLMGLVGGVCGGAVVAGFLYFTLN